LIDARDTTAAGLQTSLNTLTSQLVSQVNTQHRLGYGLDGSTTQDFFTASGTTAGTISMALTDRQKIAASSTAAGVPRQQCERPGVKQSANGLGGGIR
jgi:flagellar hook-associated protein 1 FlgK